MPVLISAILMALAPGATAQPTSPAKDAKTAADATDDTIHDSKWLYQRAEPISTNAPPIYPQALKKQAFGCWAYIQFYVMATGHVENAEAMYWSDESWKNACIKAVSKWKFKPAVRDGAPLVSRMRIEIPGTINNTTCTEAPVSKKGFSSRPSPTGMKSYPQFPNKTSIKGSEATVEFLVNIDGTTNQIKTVSTTNPAYSKAIEMAVATWRYVPARRGSRNVPCQMVVTFKTPPSR